MSIKIFNGFKFQNSNFAAIHQQIMDWRQELRPLHQNAVETFVGEVAVDIFDSELINPGSNQGTTPLMAAISTLLDRQAEVKKTQRRDARVDFEFSISLMPFEGQVYGINYTEQPGWQRLWSQKPFVADYAYWDNTEQPDDITDVEWDERGRIWKSIFDKAIMSSPSMAGFHVDCTHESITPDTHQVIRNIPTFEARVQRWANSSCLTILAQRLRQARGEPSSSMENTACLMDATRMLKEAEGVALMNEEMQRFSSILIREVTREMLLQTL